MKKHLLQIIVGTGLLFPFPHTAHAQWVQTNLPRDVPVLSLTVSGGNVFAGTVDSGLFLTTDNGANWTAVNSGLSLEGSVQCIAGSGGTIFANDDYVLMFSTNEGARWNQVILDSVPAALKDAGKGIISLAVRGNTFLAGTVIGVFSGTFSVTNNRAICTIVNTGIMTWGVNCFIVSGSNIFAGTYGGGVYLSTNNGASWSAVDSGLPSGVQVNCLAANGNNIFAGIGCNGIFLSTNNGTSWSAVDSGLPSEGECVYSLAVSGSNIFAGTLTHGVFLSTDNGTSWAAIDSGLPCNASTTILAVSDSTIFVGGGYDLGVWRRPLSELITVTNNKQQTLSQRSKGFNLTTSTQSNHTVAISFSLTQPQLVTLRIYNLSGREIATLINRNLGVGEQSLSWDTRNIAPGCYAVKMQVGTNVYAKNIPVSR